jgi:hypothetical protein
MFWRSIDIAGCRLKIADYEWRLAIGESNGDWRLANRLAIGDWRIDWRLAIGDSIDDWRFANRHCSLINRFDTDQSELESPLLTHQS